MMAKLGKTIAIIQARYGSTRLPGKVLEDLAGQPMLIRVLNRTRRARTLDSLVVATTVQPVDDAIIALCRKQKVLYYRGSENDLLDRYYQAASKFSADVIVRITSDCPLIEPEIIDRIVGKFSSLQPDIHYVTNTLVRTYPRGLDVEVISFATLKKAWQEDTNPAWREHVTQYVVRHPEIFKSHNITNEIDYSSMRWTVDTMDDLNFVRKIYTHFKNDTFSWQEVLKLLETHPQWLEINRDIQQKPVP
jgi:spore coat polysaccharide biosynthesis protein SpsF